MPKSKRSQVVSLTKTEKRTRAEKEELIDEIRECVERYAYTFLFSVEDMRNAYLKDVRAEWKDSRFFLGSNRVMAVALGRTPESEHQPNLHQLAERLSGNVGLFCTDAKPSAVKKEGHCVCPTLGRWFAEFRRADFARAGAVVSESVVLPEGPLVNNGEAVAHSLEPMLRKLGLPTVLKNGVVSLTTPYQVCTAGEPLKAEGAHVLKLLNFQLAEFHITLLCFWHKAKFTDLVPAAV